MAAVTDTKKAAPGAAAVVLFDQAGTVLSAQGSGVSALGLDAREGHPSSLFEIYAGRPSILECVRKALAGERAAVIARIAGRPFDLRFEPRLDGEGRVVGGLLAAVEPALPRRAARAAARRWQTLDLRLLLEQGLVAIWAVDRELRVVYVVGRPPRDLADTYVRGATVFDILRSSSRNDPAVLHHLAALEGESRSFTYELGGQSYEVHLEPLRDDSGRVVGSVGLGIAETARREARQRVERSVSLLRAVVESTADGLLVIDRANRVAAFNQRFVDMWRIPRLLAARGDDSVLRAAVAEQLEEPDAFDRKVRDLYDKPEAESFDVLRFRDGRVFERYSQPQRLGEEIVGRVWSFRDVTERERLLRRAEFLADASRVLASLELEKALESVAHLALRYMADSVAIDFFAGEDGPRRLLSVAHEPEKAAPGAIPSPVFKGVPVLTALGRGSRMAVPLSAHGDLLGAITLTSTRRRYAEPDLEVAQELAVRASLAIENARLHRRAQEALRTRQEFLGVAAHEIRGPVTSLQLGAQALERGKAGSDDARRALEVISRESRRLAMLVDELLDLTRFRAGRLHLDLEEVDLAEVTRTAAARLAPELGRSRSSLSLQTDPAVTGMWDRHRLDQVVTNLLSNAIKFGEGQPIDVAVKALDGAATLVVRDRGIGIPRSRQRIIFEPFERGVSSRHYGGLGLGLHVARIVVEGLNGSIRVESEPGIGSTFAVELPRRRHD